MGELARLAWPIAVSTLSYSMMTLVDTAFVAGVGQAALAGVGLAGVTCFTLTCFSVGLLRAVKVLVSQSIGAGRHDDADRYLQAGLTLAVWMGLATVVIGQVAAPLVGLMAATPEAAGHAITYMRVRILGTPLLFVYVALREARYGTGDARAPMVASILANAANIGLDYLLIVVMGTGAAGAAWSSVAGHVLEAAVLVYALENREALRLRFRRTYLAGIWRVGVPTGIQFLLEVGSFTMLTALISAMSETQMAAHQIVLHVIHFSFLPAYAVAEAGSVLAGQAVGANRDELVGVVARRAITLVAAYTGACTLLFGFGARFIVGLFPTTPELFHNAVGLMYVAVVFLMADGANVVARGLLRGTGDVRYAAVVGILCAWVTVPPLTWLLGYHFGLQAIGGWLALCLEIFAGAGVFWWRLGRGGWRRAAAQSRAEIEAIEPNQVAVAA
jgi:MATE family multidrug resistance protein